MSEDRKSIDIKIEDADVNKTNTIKLVMIIEGAPNGYKVTPNIQIKEISETEYVNLNANTIEIKNNSLQGTVKDENNMSVDGIELALVKNGDTIKKTYTDSNGNYVFSDVLEGEYSVIVDEEIYEKEEEIINIKDTSKLDIIVKEVTPYNIEIKKQITEMTIINNGKTTTYKYGNLDKVQQSLKNIKNMTGEIKYKITVKNTGKKSGIVTNVKDELPEGLNFDKTKNSSWTLENGILYNESLEGITLNAGETREETLVLDIEGTSEAKTYINKVTAYGEIYENIVYILNGKTYKEDTVLYGETINEPSTDISNFSGWYTDKNYTNKYNFKKEVTKDLVLYGKTKEIKKYNIKYIDQGKIVKEETIKENENINVPIVSKTGYTFKYWSEEQNGKEYDLNQKVTKDLTLYSVYEINSYTVKFYDKQNNKKYSLIDNSTLEKNYDETLSLDEAPVLTYKGHTFIKWTLDEEGKEEYNFSSKITKNIKLYSQYEKISLKVIFNDENRITEKSVKYDETVNKIDSKGKEGYTFKYWSDEINGEEYDFTKGITTETTLYAVYEINKYTVTFMDNDNVFGDIINVNYNDLVNKPLTDPKKEGHTFKYWSLSKNGVSYDFESKITKNIILYSVYETNEYTIKFMDEDNLYKTETVKYGNKVSKPSTNPSKEHNVFVNWLLDGVEYNFDTIITSNLTLYSSYEEIESPEITHEPAEWTNNKVIVTISSNHSDYSYMYKIDDGEYKEYTGPFDIDYNCTVVAKSMKNDISSITTSHDITNIDKIKPIINSVVDKNKTETSFDIDISSIDNESGMSKIYVYKDDLLETTIGYNDNYNEKKISSYSFSNLTSGETYKIKIKAEDIAGNISDAYEVNVETNSKIVARIIGRNNSLYENETEYENFSSLERAITSCGENDCTVQMVLDTNESVEVLGGQDITLDINGKTIRGIKDTYTILNSGNFKIVDNNTENGSIVNTNGVALKNETSGVLTLGEIEDELVVSKVAPYINGGTYGVVNEYISSSVKGTFNFYDGMISGIIAIDGEVNDKPYLYNANVVTDNDKQVATLTIIEDAEAKIERTGVYYMKVSQAVSDTYNGTISEPTTTQTTLMEGFTNIGENGFTYNSLDKTLSSVVNENSKAYTIIDLAGYENDQYLTIKSKELSSAYGNFNIVLKEDDAYGSDVSQNKTTDYSTNESTYKYLLTKGKKYYLRLEYVINSEYENNEVIITDMSFQAKEAYKITENTEFKNISDSYGFEYDESTRTLKSNNQYTKNTTAFSYLEVDLTNETEDKEIIINASLDTLYNGNIGNIIINEDNSKLSSNTYNALAYMRVYGYSSSDSSQTYVGPYNYTKTLSAGKKYYIQFYYFKTYDYYTEDQYKEYGSKDQFIINSIDVVGLNVNSETIDLEKNLKSNYYGYDTYDSSNGYTVSSNAPSGEKVDSYVKIDLRNSETDKMIDLNLKLNSGYSSIYITSNNQDSEKDLIINNMNNTLFSFDSSKNYYYIDNESKWYNFYDYKYILPKGNVYYVHFAGFYSDGKSYNYIKSISLTSVTENVINIGTLPHLKGTIDDSNKPADTNSEKNYIINDGTSDANFRFIGSNPRNYVKFNDELWRVIGIFNTTDSKGNKANRIKIVRNDILESSINTGLSWDTSVGSINNAYGINEWSQADLKDLLNQPNRKDSEYANSTSCKTGEEKNDDLPEYYLNDIIYFDPVNYKICDSEGDTCYAWYVLSGDICTGKYELIYKNTSDFNYTKAVENNNNSYDNALINYLNTITETWSDKIIKPSKSSNLNTTFDFTSSKARILNVTELSNNENELALKLKLCGTSCEMPTLVMGESNYYGLISNGLVNLNFPFSDASSPFIINPVIKINLNNVENKSDYIGKEGDNNEIINSGLYWNRKSGTCYSGVNNSTSSCDFSTVGLNSQSKKMIESVVWNTGAIPYSNSNLTAMEIYQYERGDKTGKTDFDSSSVTSSTSVDSVNRTTTWTGKVALPYISDYIMAAGSYGDNNTRADCMNGNSDKYSACVDNNDWMDIGITYPLKTLDPVYGGELPAFFAGSSGITYTLPAAMNTFVTKPAVYLNTKVKVESGSGTESNPFILSQGTKDNDTLYYGLVPELLETEEEEEETETEIKVEEETTDYTLIIGEQVYGFSFDTEKNVFTNSNKGVANSTAISYIKIDLTNSSEDLTIDINYSLNKTDYSSSAFINLMKGNLSKINYNDSSSYYVDNILYTSMARAESITKNLEKGNIYYLQFAYKKVGTSALSETNLDSFEIGITYLSNETSTDYIKYENAIPTLNKEVDTVTVIRDLNLSDSLSIENTRNMILDLNGHNITTTSKNPVINNSGNLTITDSKYVSTYENKINKYSEEISSFKTEIYSTSEFKTICRTNCYGSRFSSNEISANDNDKYNATYSNYKINFDNKYKSITGTVTFNKSYSESVNVYIGLTNDNTSYYASFDEYYIRKSISSTGDTTFTFELRPTKLGEYYLKIVLPESKTSTLKINSITSQINAIPSISYNDFSSSIYSTTGLAIKNNDGGLLNVDKTLVYSDYNAYSSGIDNYGNLTVSNGGYVKNVKNELFGEIIEGSGTIENLNTFSSKKNNIKGYTIVNTVGNYGKSDLIFDNVLIRNYGSQAVSDTSSYKLIINNSTIYAPSHSNDYVFEMRNYGDLEINNSTIYGGYAIKNVISEYSTHTANISINNSYINGIIDTEGDSDISNSTIYKINFDDIILNMDNVIIQDKSDFENNNSTVTLKNMDLTDRNVYNKKNMTIADGVLVNNLTNYSKSTLNFDNSTVNGDLYNIGNALVTNSTISGSISNRSSATITNSEFKDGKIINYGTMIISDTKMTAEKDDLVAISNPGELTITDNFKITNYTSGIVNYGTVTIGEDDDIVNNDNIVIDTVGYAIKGNSSVNYYDGTFISDNEEVINTPINIVPADYDVDYSSDNNTYKIFLNKISDKDYVAQIGNVKYKTLSDAFSSITSSDKAEVELIHDIYTILDSKIDSDKNIRLNLNNNKIVYYKNDNPLIINDGTFDFYSSDDSSITNRVYGEKLLENNGTINYNNINLNCYYNNLNTITNNGIMNYNSGNFNHINDNTIKKAIFITNNSNLNIYNGTFNGRDYIVSASENSNTNVVGGIFETGNISVFSSGTTNVTGGTYKTYYAFDSSGTLDISHVDECNSNYLVSNSGISKIHDLEISLKKLGNNSGTIEVNNNTFSTDTKDFFSNNGTAKFNNNSITSTSSNIITGYGTTNISNDSYVSKGDVVNASYVNINNSNFTSLSDNGINAKVKLTINNSTITSLKNGILLSGTATLTSENTIIKSTDESTSYSAISSTTTGNVNIISGTYTSNGIAIKNTGENVITFGIQGDVDDEGNLSVSITNPEITGSTAGIKTGSKTVFNFYDGIFTGDTPIDGNVYEVEDEYSVIQKNNSKYLVKEKIDIMVVKNLTTDKEYSELQTAINEASNEDVLQVINEISTLVNAKVVTVPKDLEVTIDVNGYKINKNNSILISNLGNLKITNSNYNETEPSIDDGGIYNTNSGTIIYNYGTLKLEKIYIQSECECNEINNTEDGTLTIKNSVIDNTYSSEFSNSLIINDGLSTIESLNTKTNGISITNNGTMSTSNSKVERSNLTTIINNTSVFISENDNFHSSINNSTDNSDLSLTNTTISAHVENEGILNSNNSIIQGTIQNNGTLTANGGEINSSDINNTSIMNIVNVTVTGYSSYKCILKNYSSDDALLNLKDSNIIVKSTKDIENDSQYAIEILTGKLILDNTTVTRDTPTSFSSTSDYSYYGIIKSDNASEIKITKGTYTFSVGKFLTLINPDTVVNIEDANIATKNGIFMESKYVSNTINLNNVTMSNTGAFSTSILNCNSSYSSVSCGDYEPNSTTSNGAKITVEDGNIDGNITLDSNDYISLTNMSVNSDISGVGTIKIDNSTTKDITGAYNVEMNSGTIDGSISNLKSNAIIKSGEVSGSITGKSKVTLGIKDSNVSIISPSIGDKITVSNIYFYDGIVKGDIPKPIEVEDGYNVKVSSDGYYLVNTPVIKNTSSNKEYSNIRAAINEISNNDTLQLIDNVWIYTNNIDGGIINENNSITFDINGKKIYTTNVPFINNGTLNMIDSSSSGEIDYASLIENNGIINASSGSFAVTNNNTLNNDGATISGTNASRGTIMQNSGVLNNFTNNGTLTVNDGTVESLVNENDANINGGTVKKITNKGSITIKNVNASNFNFVNRGTSVIENMNGTAYISNGRTLDIYNSSISSINSNNVFYNSRILRIHSGNYVSNGSFCLENTGTLTIGEEGGNVSVSSPEIKGGTYAVENTGTFNFYDGKLIGSTAPISGTITNVENGYKFAISDDTENSTKVGYLALIADDERVAMVNGINFTDLQTAINSVKDNVESNIVIYKDIELSEDITIPENKIINLYLNGYTITYGNYNFVKNGTLDIISSGLPEGVAANIIQTIADVLNINTKTSKNIIIYEMEDGTNLSTENTYNLYMKDDGDYKLVNMDKEEVGKYKIGNENSDMTSIKNRIYINNLDVGIYKLVDNNNKELSFTITDDGKINGNVKENIYEKSKVSATALAYLILTIQTGNSQIKYIIYMIVLLIAILTLFFLIKKGRTVRND